MRRVCSIVAAVICGCSAFAHAEDRTLFPQGTWDVEASGGYASEVYPNDHQKITTATLGVGYYPRDNFAISLQVPGYYVEQADDHADAIGFNLSLRYHFYQAGRFTFFADIIGGLSQATREVPPGGTHFNFTLQFGPGVTYELVDHVHLYGGARLFHLSNAAIEGIDRNPDLNAIEGYAGVLFTF
jgi:opacity protein-like surface antigen